MSTLVYPRRGSLKTVTHMEKLARRTRKNPSTKAGGRKPDPNSLLCLWGGEESVANTAGTLVAQGPREGTQASCSTVAAPAGSGDLPLAAALTPSTKATVTCPGAAVPSGPQPAPPLSGSPGKEAQRPSWLKNPPVFFLLVTSGKCYTYIKTWQTHSLR